MRAVVHLEECACGAWGLGWLGLWLTWQHECPQQGSEGGRPRQQKRRRVASAAAAADEEEEEDDEVYAPGASDSDEAEEEPVAPARPPKVRAPPVFAIHSQLRSCATPRVLPPGHLPMRGRLFVLSMAGAGRRALLCALLHHTCGAPWCHNPVPVQRGVVVVALMLPRGHGAGTGAGEAAAAQGADGAVERAQGAVPARAGARALRRQAPLRQAAGPLQGAHCHRLLSTLQPEGSLPQYACECVCAKVATMATQQSSGSVSIKVPACYLRTAAAVRFSLMDMSDEPRSTCHG